MSATPSKDSISIYDGCTAAAHVAYANSDTSFIYPITPSTTMAEAADLWKHQGRKNIFGTVCEVRQMQSEAGAAGAVHGGLQVGSLTTTFTASQGLLLMIPNMYKIAGELLPCVFHVAARAIATQALSIFGDHSDVMAVRQTGWGLLSSTNVQDAMDLGQIAHMATVTSSIPFVHFFDGFRTSHELQKVRVLSNETILELIDQEGVARHRARGLNSAHPRLIGTAQGPEVYFQNVEASNQYYNVVPDHVEKAMDKFAEVTGRKYSLFRYHGHPEATDIIVVMGAASPVIEEAVDYIMKSSSIEGDKKKVGVVTVRLYRPWKLTNFIEAFPKTVQRIAVLDRTKESGAFGEPLFLDVVASFHSVGKMLKIIGGRYGLGSKDFTPAMVLAIYDNLLAENSKPRFTVGVEDDVTHLSLDWKPHAHISTVPEGTSECLFWGMGSDGTVGANKNVIKIIGDNTDLFVQGYFAYSAHKAGGLTVSHLRFGPKSITSQYLINAAGYVACHRDAYVYKYNMIEACKEGGVFVLNCPWKDSELEEKLPGKMRRNIAEKQLQLYTLDANKVAIESKMGRRVNNILMTVFFKLSGVLPFEEAITLFKKVIQKTYGKKGPAVVEANWTAVDAAVAAVHRVEYDSNAWLHAKDTALVEKRKLEDAPQFVNSVLLPLERMEGESLPVSTFVPFAGGSLPLGTAAYEKRGIALRVPIVDMEKCTQCNYCSFVCPHAAIRPFLLDDDEAETAPKSFESRKTKGAPEIAAFRYRIQVSPMDCTGCDLCSIACPASCLTMTPLEDVQEEQSTLWDFAVGLERREELMENSRSSIKGSQFYQPLMEFSGACEGCGETPYMKLMTQLFGERMVIANATGCSSIWGASYPSVPYTTNKDGMGPAWGNSLFEDNAEYGYGMMIAMSHRRKRYHEIVKMFLEQPRIDGVPAELYTGLAEFVENWCDDPALCTNLYRRLGPMIEKYAASTGDALLKKVDSSKNLIVKTSHWIVGGDGWAYDIGYGGLDHVLASGVDINIVVLDTEVYSNTGGQVSKATPMGAVHKFGAAGVLRPKKDLGSIAMEYGQIYVASVSSSANMAQTVRAFVEAEKFPGPSIILAYAPCIEHGYIKPFSAQQVHCKMAVDCGYWPLYRHDPRNLDKGLPALQLDSKKLKGDVRDMLHKENRFEQLFRSTPEVAELAMNEVHKWCKKRFEMLQWHASGTLGKSADAATGDAISILFGSETGNAEGVANRIAENMKDRGMSPKVISMGDVDIDELAEMKHVVIVCSTAGQGAMPENAKGFWEKLSSKDVPADLLKDTKYAVFGLGDSSYIYFNLSAKQFDDRFKELGASRIMSIGMGDDQHEEKFDTVLSEWLPTYWETSQAPEPKNIPDEPPVPRFHSEILEGFHDATKQCVPYDSKLIQMDVSRRITPADYDVEVTHYEFNLTGTGIKYALGDSLAVFPQTPKSLVDEFCRIYGFDPETVIRIKRAPTAEGSAKHEALYKHPLTVRQLFTECIDLGGKPTRGFYEKLPRYCGDEAERTKARAILSKEGKPAFLEMVNKEMVNVLDMLKKFPSTIKTLSYLDNAIELLPLHKPRYYSIASAQKFVGENRVHLCIGTVDWKTAQGEKRFGGCTGYLRTLKPELSPEPIMVAAAIKVTAFHLPPSDSHPIIMAGMGTGLAPFRAFIQYRAWLKRAGKPSGPVVLYFGCRYAKKDYLYGDELVAYEKEGVLTELRVAFSRDQKEKFYVQHHIERDPALLYRRLVKEGGHFYLCGSAKQVPIDIRAAVVKALVSEGDMTKEQADDCINQMMMKGQYNVEAW